jgi:hypothetical protein
MTARGRNPRAGMSPESPTTPARRPPRAWSRRRAWRVLWAANRRPEARSPARERSPSRANPRQRGAGPWLPDPNRAFQGPSEARPGSNRATRGSSGAAWGLKPVPERLARPALGWLAGRRPGRSRPAGAARRSGVGVPPSGGRSGEAGWAGPTPTGLPLGAGPGSWVGLGAGPGSWAGPPACRWARRRRLRRERGRRCVGRVGGHQCPARWRRAAARRRPGWRSRGRTAALAISRWRPRPCLAGAGRAAVR